MDIKFIRMLIGKANEKYTDEELLTISPNILRDLYLKRLYDGTLQGPLTGDLYQDKPWVQNYPESANEKFLLDDTMYRTYIRETEDLLDNIAIISFEGKKYTHREFREMITSLAQGLTSQNIKEDSKVGVLLLNTVEEPTSVMALSALGANAKMVDFSKGPFETQKSIEASNLEMLILDEKLIDWEPIINPNKIPVVVVNSTKEYEQSHIMTYEELIEKGVNTTFEVAEKDPKRIALTITSSGTTGTPKPIMHTDANVNNSAQGFIHTDFPLGTDNIMIKAVPGFIGLGVITTMYTSLVTGTPLLLVTGDTPAEMTAKASEVIINFEDFKNENDIPSELGLIMFAAPIYVRHLVSQYDRIKDLSYIKGLLVAGSKMTKEELDEMEKILGEKGLKVPINNAYGQNEHGGGVTTNSPNHNKNGSAGYPLIGRNVYIVDQDTLDVIRKNAQGIIVEDTPTMFVGYEGMPEKTQSTKIYLADGKMSKTDTDGIECFNSEDIGMIDEEGYIHVTGRMSRVLVRFDCKMAVEKIESKISKLEGVEECAMVSFDGDSPSYDIGVAFVKLDDSIENAEEYVSVIMNDIYENKTEVTEFERPDVIVPVKEIPYMSNGKVDYNHLKQRAKEIVASKKEKENALKKEKN